MQFETDQKSLQSIRASVFILSKGNDFQILVYKSNHLYLKHCT
jgi:hypothetical protein